MPSGHTVRLRKWQPSQEASPRRPQSGSPLLMVHGIGGRSAWMSPLAWPLADKKPHVYGLDLKNISYAPNNVGKFSTYTDLVNELRETVQWLYQEHGQPVFLAAHGMGGVVSTLVAADPPRTKAGQSMLKGVILLAPTYAEAPKLNSATSQLKVLCRNLYRFALEKLGLRPEPIMLGGYYSLNNLSSNPQKHQLTKEAKDRVTRFTPVAWRELHRMTGIATEDAHKVDVSTLMMIPAHDAIASPDEMERLFRFFPAKDKQMIIYHNSKHDLVWEPVLNEMAQVINRWMTARSVSFRQDAE